MIAWQIDNGIGGHDTESSFNEETRRDWIAWLQAKYETIERLNELLGTRFWGQLINLLGRSSDADVGANRAQSGLAHGLAALFQRYLRGFRARCRPICCTN